MVKNHRRKTGFERLELPQPVDGLYLDGRTVFDSMGLVLSMDLGRKKVLITDATTACVMLTVPRQERGCVSIRYAPCVSKRSKSCMGFFSPGRWRCHPLVYAAYRFLFPWHDPLGPSPRRCARAPNILPVDVSSHGANAGYKVIPRLNVVKNFAAALR